MPIRTILVGLMVLSAFGAAPTLVADDHYVREVTNTYMGRTAPPRQYDLWVSRDRAYLKNGPFVTIVRADFSKRYIVNTLTRVFYEMPASALVQAKKPRRIQEYGFNHEPAYTWTIEETGRSETIDGHACRTLVLHGEADYTEVTREIWLATDLAGDRAHYYQFLVKPDLDLGLQALYERTEALKSGVVVKEVKTSEPPIAPTIVVNSRLVKFEIAPAPAGIYDIPPGCKQVKSEDELYAR
jgi:hypothetical protein